MVVNVDSNFMLQVGDEIGLVKSNPRLLIIVSHSFIEMIVKTLSHYHLPKVKLKNHHQRLEKLKKEKVIDKFQFQLYDWFRELRNRAVHTPIFRLNDADFEPLHGLAKKEQLGVNSFHLFSIILISELWNKHLDVLGPVYLKKT